MWCRSSVAFMGLAPPPTIVSVKKWKTFLLTLYISSPLSPNIAIKHDQYLFAPHRHKKLFNSATFLLCESGKVKMFDQVPFITSKNAENENWIVFVRSWKLNLIKKEKNSSHTRLRTIFPLLSADWENEKLLYVQKWNLSDFYKKRKEKTFVRERKLL